jgi:hypothetical protein
VAINVAMIAMVVGIFALMCSGSGVILYTFPLPLPEVVPPNTLSLYILDRVELGLDED